MALHNRQSDVQTCLDERDCFALAKQVVNTLTIPGATLHEQPHLLCVVCTHDTVSLLCQGIGLVLKRNLGRAVTSSIII